MIIKNNPGAILLDCEPVKNEEVDEIIKLLENELELSRQQGFPGIGLAAPQIGLAKRAAIVRIDDVKINLINCKITKAYDKFIFKEEGCLSFPNRVENTYRFNEIVVEDNLVYPFSFSASGLIAVCCQHEIEHFNGKLFYEHKVLEKKKQSPNEKCLCGSNIKYKKCCGK